MKDKDVKNQLQQVINTAIHYRVLIFMGVVVVVYGFVIWRVNTLANVQPTASQVASELNSTSPHIDQATINKVKQLQDNSVNVQALFNQARQNPFHE